ncbi:MAG: hypothetical protein AB1598_07620 [Thermodesulfobacteriota bacterium]
MTYLEKEILNLYRERSIQEGRGFSQQVIPTVIFERTNLKEHPNIVAELAEALGNLIEEGYLKVSDENSNALVLTESGHKEIYA